MEDVPEGGGKLRSSVSVSALLAPVAGGACATLDGSGESTFRVAVTPSGTGSALENVEEHSSAGSNTRMPLLRFLTIIDIAPHAYGGNMGRASHPDPSDRQSMLFPNLSLK
ncbi:hypothetical protein [Caballeronia ptereochthonis]|uniref:hypothetical protein n=1 Tax=Caballeronia ptereochthonis TaxID=1777144 RepID=UPI00135C9516|nr:hypothetical protein [Caballeronia ptereochthonis]